MSKDDEWTTFIRIDPTYEQFAQGGLVKLDLDPSKSVARYIRLFCIPEHGEPDCFFSVTHFDVYGLLAVVNSTQYDSTASGLGLDGQLGSRASGGGSGEEGEEDDEDTPWDHSGTQSARDGAGRLNIPNFSLAGGGDHHLGQEGGGGLSSSGSVSNSGRKGLPPLDPNRTQLPPGAAGKEKAATLSVNVSALPLSGKDAVGMPSGQEDDGSSSYSSDSDDDLSLKLRLTKMPFLPPADGSKLTLTKASSTGMLPVTSRAKPTQFGAPPPSLNASEMYENKLLWRNLAYLDRKHRIVGQREKEAIHSWIREEKKKIEWEQAQRAARSAKKMSLRR